MASREGHSDVIRALLDNGADVNIRLTGGRRAGETALTIASKTGHPDVAELLRQHGARQ